MRGVEGEIKIKWFVWILRVDVFHRVIAEELGRVTFFADGLVVAIPIEHAGFLVRVVIQLADHRAVLVIEAALLRPIFLVGVAEMPLANDGCVISRFLEACGMSHSVVSSP